MPLVARVFQLAAKHMLRHRRAYDDARLSLDTFGLAALGGDGGGVGGVQAGAFGEVGVSVDGLVDVLAEGNSGVEELLYVRQACRLVFYGQAPHELRPTDQEVLLHEVVRQWSGHLSGAVILMCAKVHDLYRGIHAQRMMAQVGSGGDDGTHGGAMGGGWDEGSQGVDLYHCIHTQRMMAQVSCDMARECLCMHGCPNAKLLLHHILTLFSASLPPCLLPTQSARHLSLLPDFLLYSLETRRGVGEGDEGGNQSKGRESNEQQQQQLQQQQQQVALRGDIKVPMVEPHGSWSTVVFVRWKAAIPISFIATLSYSSSPPSAAAAASTQATQAQRSVREEAAAAVPADATAVGDAASTPTTCAASTPTTPLPLSAPSALSGAAAAAGGGAEAAPADAVAQQGDDSACLVRPVSMRPRASAALAAGGGAISNADEGRDGDRSSAGVEGSGEGEGGEPMPSESPEQSEACDLDLPLVLGQGEPFTQLFHVTPRILSPTVSSLWPFPPVLAANPILVASLRLPPFTIVGSPFSFSIRLSNCTTSLQEVVYQLQDAPALSLQLPLIRLLAPCLAAKLYPCLHKSWLFVFPFAAVVPVAAASAAAAAANAAAASAAAPAAAAAAGAAAAAAAAAAVAAAAAAAAAAAVL
ncbi:unnamed protein product [Closterium sp. NIES-65]|nr:unnamed protein product [Closterium sp. NIES-65]